MSASGLFLLHNQSDRVAQVVDMVRNVVGPRPVAMVEETVFWVEDWFNRTTYQVTGNSSSGWQLVAPLEQAAAQPSGSGHNSSKPITPLAIEYRPNLNVNA